MAKKKKKRIAGKPAAKSAKRPAVSAAAAGAPAKPQAAPASKPAVAVADHSHDYALTDLSRIGLLAGACIILQLAAWYLLNHTGLGSHIYSLVRV